MGRDAAASDAANDAATDAAIAQISTTVNFWRPPPIKTKGVK